jgi:hypothetical protein
MTQRVTIPGYPGEWELARHMRVDDVYLECTFRKVEQPARKCAWCGGNDPAVSYNGKHFCSISHMNKYEASLEPKPKESVRLFTTLCDRHYVLPDERELYSSLADYIIARVKEELK